MAKKRLTQWELSRRKCPKRGRFSCEKSPLRKMCTGWSNVESGSRLNYEAIDGSFISSSFSHLKGKGKKKKIAFFHSPSPALKLIIIRTLSIWTDSLQWRIYGRVSRRPRPTSFIGQTKVGRAKIFKGWISVLPPPAHKHLLTDLNPRLLSFTPGVSYSKNYEQSNFSICRISIVV